MSFKSKAEQQFEIKFAAAMQQQDFVLVEKVLNQYGCYLDLIEPLPESYGLPVVLCDELDCNEDHVWTDDTGIKMWCSASQPITAGQIAHDQYSEAAIMARITAATEKALKES